MNFMRLTKKTIPRVLTCIRMYGNELGSGAGKGGGGGGSIREAGGAFGKIEAGREEEYFYKKHYQQLAELKSHLDQEICFHEEQIQRHASAIKRHKEKLENIADKKDKKGK